MKQPTQNDVTHVEQPEANESGEETRASDSVSAQPTMLESTVIDGQDTIEDTLVESSATAARPDSRLLPRPFGDYTLLSEVAPGGMGVVYRALQESLQRPVALKRVLDGKREQSLRRRFLAEALVTGSLDHPNIVPLISYAQDGDDRFLIMKYVEGTPLDDLIEGEGKLSFERAESIFRDLLSALGYAHTHGVIHRDVKPTNVKLRDRAVRIVQEMAGCDVGKARAALVKAGWNVKQACAIAGVRR